MEQVNIFEQATRKKLLFPTTNGQLYVQDLWDLSIERLAILGKLLHSNVKDNEEQDNLFDTTTVSKPKVEEQNTKLKLEVVKYIFDTKVEEKKAKDEAEKNKKEKARLQEILLNKKESELQGKSAEEIQKMIDALD